VRVRIEHHGFCGHESDAWNTALSAALACSGCTISPMARQSTIRSLMQRKDKGIWHQGVHFVGEVI